MPQITFIDASGQIHIIDAPAGQSLMQAAVSANFAGIVGECGGAAMCATCHVYVDEAWVSLMPPMENNESDMLDCVNSQRQANSRLSCQLTVQPGWAGLCVVMPANQ
jgi:ferredoxin, 2Fe-2S